MPSIRLAVCGECVSSNSSSIQLQHSRDADSQRSHRQQRALATRLLSCVASRRVRVVRRTQTQDTIILTSRLWRCCRLGVGSLSMDACICSGRGVVEGGLVRLVYQPSRFHWRQCVLALAQPLRQRTTLMSNVHHFMSSPDQSPTTSSELGDWSVVVYFTYF